MTIRFVYTVEDSRGFTKCVYTSLKKAIKHYQAAYPEFRNRFIYSKINKEVKINGHCVLYIGDQKKKKCGAINRYQYIA